VSWICAGLDTEVADFRDRSLAAQDFPYVFLDASHRKARVGHRIVSRAAVVVIGFPSFAVLAAKRERIRSLCRSRFVFSREARGLAGCAGWLNASGGEYARRMLVLIA
jgi:hypothetical protein